MSVTHNKRPLLRIKQKQSTRQVQKMVIAGSLFSLFAFTCIFLYWNIGVKSDALAGVSYTWNGSSDSLWSNSTNWTPSGIPGTGDIVTINTGNPRYPLLDANCTISNLTMGTGSQLNMNGFSLTTSSDFTISGTASLNTNGSTLQINGNGYFYGGTILNSGSGGEVRASGAVTVFGNGSGGPTIHPKITVNTGSLLIRNSTFNGIADFTRSSAVNENAVGNNTFNGATSITNAGTGYFVMSNNTRDIYNGDLTLNSIASGVLYIAHGGVNTQFNQHIYVNSSGGGVRISASSGTSTLAAGKKINIGTSGFTSGTLLIGRVTCAGNTDQSLNLSGNAVLTLGPGTLFTGQFAAQSPGLSLSGATFNSKADFEKTGSSNDNGSGNCTFNDSVTITNSGTGYTVLANSTRDIFNGPVTFNSTSSGLIYVAHNGTDTQFNENVFVSSTSTGGVRFGASNGTSLIASGKDILIGTSGFASGALQLGGITFPGSTPRSFSLGTSAVLTLGPSSTFNGDLTSVSGGLCLSGCTFIGKLTATKTGVSNDNGNGNNTYNDTVDITNSGSGYMVMSNSTRDVFNAYTKFTCLGGAIYVAHNGVNTLFNEQVEVNSTGPGGIRIGASNGTSTLLTGKSIVVGSTGFTSGILQLGRILFDGGTSQNISTTGSSVITLGPAINCTGDMTVSAGGVCLNGGTYAGNVTIVKNGTSNDAGSGNNTFNGNISITNNGSGYLLTANSTRDIFNGIVDVNTTSSGIIYLAHNGTNTQFNDDVKINSSGTGGVRFGASGGTSTLSAGKYFSAGASGFSSGTLVLSRITFAGTEAQNINLGTAATVYLGTAAVFNGNMVVNSGSIFLNSAIYNGEAEFIKTGTSNDAGNGGNTFNADVRITNSGTGYFLTANSTADVFGDDLTVTCLNSGLIYLAHNGSNTQFNGNISLNCTGSAGIRFGSNSGTSTLAANKIIAIGTTGYTSGELNFKRLTQTGTTAQTLNVSSGSAILYVGTGCVFNGVVNYKFPQLALNGATFNATATFEKAGAVNNTSSGGNVFNGDVNIVNSGTGNFVLANSTTDDYNANASFVQTGTGALLPASNVNCTFAGNISTTGSTSIITFSNASGTVTMDGTVGQNIYGSTSFIPVFRRLNLNNSAAGITLNSPVNVTVALTLTNGVLYSSAVNYLNIGSGISTVSGVSDLSYVSGPVRKTGNVAFIFPTGKNGKYRPISISAPVTATDQFVAEYFGANPDSAYPVANKDVGIFSISRCEFWSLSRTAGAANIRTGLSWSSPVSCGITAIADLLVARWDAVQNKWVSHGNSGSVGTTSSGTLTAMSTSSTYGIFTLGSISGANSLPVELVSFAVTKEGDAALALWTTQSEKNNDYFTIERSVDGNAFEQVGRVNGAGNSLIKRNYSFTDLHPLSGVSYYRLKQTDFNGQSETFNIVVYNSGVVRSGFNINTIGPNPFVNELNITMNSELEGNARATIYNTQGTIVFEQDLDLSSGSSLLTLTLNNDMPPGIYFLKIIQGDVATEPYKLIKK